jgi:hypothetical protein
VGPICEGGDFGEAEILASCYRCSLHVADELGARSVAFPAIATGVYGFPPNLAAQIAVTTIRSTSTRAERIRLVAFDAPPATFSKRPFIPDPSGSDATPLSLPGNLGLDAHLCRRARVGPSAREPLSHHHFP